MVGRGSTYRMRFIGVAIVGTFLGAVGEKGLFPACLSVCVEAQSWPPLVKRAVLSAYRNVYVIQCAKALFKGVVGMPGQ